LIKQKYKVKDYFASMKHLIKLFELSPNNAKGKSYLPKIYTKLNANQKKLVKDHIKKQYLKYKANDPPKGDGYKRLYIILTE
ncbi:hypothetical protein ACFL6D_04905, partial [Spirochaetota bacterium]